MNMCKCNCSNFPAEIPLPPSLPPNPPTHAPHSLCQLQNKCRLASFSQLCTFMLITFDTICITTKEVNPNFELQQLSCVKLSFFAKLLVLSHQVSHPFACQKPTCPKCCTKFPQSSTQQETAGSKPAAATSPSVTPPNLRGDAAVTLHPSHPVVTQGVERSYIYTVQIMMSSFACAHFLDICLHLLFVFHSRRDPPV